MSVRISPIDMNPGAVVAGVDVGEDFLDFAIIGRGWNRIEYRRVELREIRPPAIESLRERIISAAPGLARGAIAVVDSPRWPRDLDASRRCAIRRDGERTGREIDRSLRAVYRRIAAAERISPGLSMFPTPRLEYFQSCIADEACKPHLRAIGRELFGDSGPIPAPITKSGALFTRFMLAGFALYRAMESIGIVTFESFPDLQFRLCAPRPALLSKNRGRAALEMRRRIIARLIAQLGVRGAPPATIDHADAAILALSLIMAARCGASVSLECEAEGRFMIALAPAHASLFTRDEIITREAAGRPMRARSPLDNR